MLEPALHEFRDDGIRIAEIAIPTRYDRHPVWLPAEPYREVELLVQGLGEEVIDLALQVKDVSIRVKLLWSIARKLPRYSDEELDDAVGEVLKLDSAQGETKIRLAAGAGLPPFIAQR